MKFSTVQDVGSGILAHVHYHLLLQLWLHEREELCGGSDYRGDHDFRGFSPYWQVGHAEEDLFTRIQRREDLFKV